MVTITLEEHAAAWQQFNEKRPNLPANAPSTVACNIINPAADAVENATAVGYTLGVRWAYSLAEVAREIFEP